MNWTLENKYGSHKGRQRWYERYRKLSHFSTRLWGGKTGEAPWVWTGHPVNDKLTSLGLTQWVWRLTEAPRLGENHDHIRVSTSPVWQWPAEWSTRERNQRWKTSVLFQMGVTKVWTQVVTMEIEKVWTMLRMWWNRLNFHWMWGNERGRERHQNNSGQLETTRDVFFSTRKSDF